MSAETLIAQTDLQTRKLNLISYLANLQDEYLVERFEVFAFGKETDAMPFSQAELIARINQSEYDVAHGNTKTQTELEKLSSLW